MATVFLWKDLIFFTYGESKRKLYWHDTTSYGARWYGLRSKVVEVKKQGIYLLVAKR